MPLANPRFSTQKLTNTIGLLLSKSARWATLLVLLGAMGGGTAQANLEYYQVDDNAMLHFMKAQQWVEFGQPAQAIGEYQAAIKLKPATGMTAVLYNNLGLTWLKLKQVDQAIVAFQEALELSPQNHQLYENLVKAYQQGNRAEDATNQLVDQLTRNSSDDQAWYLLGLLYESLSYKAYAEEAYQNVVLLAPKSFLSDAARQRLKDLTAAP